MPRAAELERLTPIFAMWQYIVKVTLTAVVIVAVTEIAKRNPLWAALLASLPLTSLLAFVWHTSTPGNGSGLPRCRTASSGSSFRRWCWFSYCRCCFAPAGDCGPASPRHVRPPPQRISPWSGFSDASFMCSSATPRPAFAVTPIGIAAPAPRYVCRVG